MGAVSVIHTLPFGELKDKESMTIKRC